MPLNNITSVNNVMKNKEMAKDINRESVHMGLMAAGLTPGYGIFADVADAALYLMEGEFGEAALSGLSAIPFIGQYASSLRILETAKKAGEPTVKFFTGKNMRGHDAFGKINEKKLIKNKHRAKYSEGLDKNVPEGNYVGAGDFEQMKAGDYTGTMGGYGDTARTAHQPEFFGKTGPTRELPAQSLFVSTDPKVAEMYARRGFRGANMPADMINRKPIILEFEVPVSWLRKNQKNFLSADKNLYDTYNIGGPGANEAMKRMKRFNPGQASKYSEDIMGTFKDMTVFDKGLSKGFLTRVHRYDVKQIPMTKGQNVFDLVPKTRHAKKGLTSTWDDITRETEGYDKLIKEIFKVIK